MGEEGHGVTVEGKQAGGEGTTRGVGGEGQGGGKEGRSREEYFVHVQPSQLCICT